MRALPAPADHLIAYRTVDFERRARQITGDPAVEFILDAISGDSLKKGYQLLAPTGRLAVCGASLAATSKTGGASGILSMLASTPWLQFNQLSLMNANKRVFGVNLGIATSSACGATPVRLKADCQTILSDSLSPQ